MPLRKYVTGIARRIVIADQGGSGRIGDINDLQSVGVIGHISIIF